MSKVKRYYWLKLNENFFEDDTMTWLEEQDNGKDYIIFYLKLCLKSLSDDGFLVRYVGEKLIPYDVRSLSKITSTPYDTVSMAMKIFIEIGLISQYDTGEIYMNQINELIGTETDSAKRMRKKRIKDEVKQLPSHCDKDVHLCDTEKEIDKELEIDKDKELPQPSDNGQSTSERFEVLWKEYPKKQGKKKALTYYKRSIKNGTTDEVIMQGIEDYKKYLDVNKSWLKPMDGSRWFNEERWNDEYDDIEAKQSSWAGSDF